MSEVKDVIVQGLWKNNSALVQLLHATGQTEQARERLDELEQLDDSHDDLSELRTLFEPAGKNGKSLWSKVKGWLG